MGEISEMVLEGTLCQVCGGLMPDLVPKEEGMELKAPPGYPRTCPECKKLDQEIEKASDEIPY